MKRKLKNGIRIRVWLSFTTRTLKRKEKMDKLPSMPNILSYDFLCSCSPFLKIKL